MTPPSSHGRSGRRSGGSALPLLLLAAAVVAGTWARFQILDGRQWTTDEYFFLESVGFILEKGVPAFDTGGYYVRGLALQYLTAGLWWVFGESTALARGVSFVCGLATIGLGFLYARRYVSRPGALAVAGMLALSSWQIEFSGFARMYAALQVGTLAYLIALDRAFAGTGPRRYLPHAILLALAFVHEQVVVLAPLVFLPLVAGRSPRPAVEVGAGVVVMLAVAAFVMFDFRNLGVGPILPAGYGESAAAGALETGPHEIGGFLIWVPAFPFWSVAGDPFLSSVFCGAVLGGAGVVWGVLYARGRAGIEHLWAVWLLLAAGMHQLVIAGIAGAVLVLRYDLLDWTRTSRVTYAFVATGVLAAAAWIVWGFTHLDGWLAHVDPTDLPRTVRLTFLALPNFFDPVVFPWRDALPRLGAAFALCFGVCAWLRRKAPVADLAQSPLAVVAISFAILALVETPQITTRYSFYLYPVLLTLLVLALEDGLRGALGRRHAVAPPLAAALALAVFALGGDFHPNHIADPRSKEASFRIGPYRRYEDLWYQRIDFRSPAEFLNAQIPSDRPEPILVVGQDPVAHSLERPFAVYFPPDSRAFAGLARERGTIHIWSAQPIVSTPEQAREWIGGMSTIWIVRSSDASRAGFDPADLVGSRLRAADRAHLSEDGRLEVVRVTLDPAAGRTSGNGS